jgi:histone acetyltransferase (RNA polymerase elongator complex component)
MPTKQLIEILKKCRELFPECHRIGIYATPKAIVRKTFEELKELQIQGLTIVYLGVESGSDRVLLQIKKGANQAQIVEAGQKIKAADIKLSITLISGLGGKALWQEHALANGQIIDLLQPDYVGLLTLLLEFGTELYDQHAQGEFVTMTPLEILSETKLMLENINQVKNCIFRSNHVSNYLALAGTLIQDKQRLINSLEAVLQQPSLLPNKSYRQL